MVMRMMKKIAVLCVAASASLLWCGCDRKPAAGEKQAAPSGKREEPAEEKGEAAAWRERLDAASAKAAREKGNDREHVKTLNDVAALYAEGLQNGWAHPLDVRSWCDSVAETGSGYSGRRLSAPCSCTEPASSVMPERPGSGLNTGWRVQEPSGGMPCTCWA